MDDWRDKYIPEKCRDCEYCEKYTDLYIPYNMSYWRYSCKRNKNCYKQISKSRINQISKSRINN